MNLLRHIPVALLFCSAASLHAELSPPPSAADQSKALAMVQGVFKDEYAKRTPADRAALGVRLLREALATKDDLNARFVLLSESAAMASAGGDVTTAMSAIDNLAAQWHINTLDSKVRALTRAAGVIAAGTNIVANESVATQALQLGEQAAQDDDFTTATQLANLAEAAANRSKRVAFVTDVTPRLAALRALAAEFNALAPHRAALAKNADDPEANLALGRYYCFTKAQWPKGLPHLAKSSDAALAKLAAKELTAPKEPLDIVALADGWWDLAEKSPAATKPTIARHAAVWYQQAADGLQGITLTRIQQRIKTASTGTVETPTTKTATTATTSGTNLLALIDPAKDAAVGQWSMRDGAIIGDEGRYSIMQIPYAAPDEYELRVTFTRLDGDGPITLLLHARGENFGFALDVKGEARFERVAGKINKDNPTTVPVKIDNNRRYTVTVQVKKDELVALLDDKFLTRYKTDFKDLSRYAVWKMKDDKQLGLGINVAKVRFEKIELIEPATKGRTLR